ERMLVERRVNRIVARMTARLLVRKGTRIARESQFSQPVVNAIRFLARSRRRSAILRRAQFLLDVCEKTSTVQTIFCNAGFYESEFRRALKFAVEGDQLACRRVGEIALSIASRLLNSRGPKVRAASA